MKRPHIAAAVAALALALSLSCAASAAAWDEFLVVTTDYTAYGSLAVVQRDEPWTAAPDVEPVGSDSIARWRGGLCYVVDRGGSNLQIVDPAAGYATVGQFSLGSGLNPQDIAFGSDGTAWIDCYDAAKLLNVDPANGAILAEYSTAGFADADGLPETAWMQAVGDRLFIVCQRLDRADWYVPTGQSLLLVFDMAAKQWIDADPSTGQVDGIALAGQNPFARPVVVDAGAGLAIGSAGWFGLPDDGGIEIVDTAALTTGGLIAGGDRLGGDLLDFEIAAPDRWYAIVSDASYVTSVVAFDPAGSGAPEVVARAAGYDYADLACDGSGQVFLADQALGAAGIRVFAAATGLELTGAQVPVGRKPFQIVLPVDSVTGVESGPPPALRMAAPWPNPANPAVNFGFAAASGSRIDLAVCDLRGRVLRRASVAVAGDGSGAWRFDGRDSAGRPLASGVYRILLRDGAAVASRGFSLVR